MQIKSQARFREFRLAAIAGAGIFAAALLLSGCGKSIKQAPDETDKEFRQRQNLELFFTRWDYRPSALTAYGQAVIARVIGLPPSLWGTLVGGPTYTGTTGSLCRQGRPAPEGPIPTIDCLQTKRIDGLTGCKERGFPGPRCVNIAFAPGLLNDAEVVRRLQIAAQTPCKTFPHMRKFPPNPDLVYDLRNAIPLFEAAFICTRNGGNGTWIYRMALTDSASGKVALFPEEFGGRVEE